MKSYSKPRKLRRRGRLTSTYYCKVYDRETGVDTYISTRCKSYKAAEEWRRTREIDDAMGPERRAAKERKERTFAKAYDAWIESKRGAVSDKHYGVLKARGDKFWQAAFGKLRLDEVTSEHVRTYLRRRRNGTVPRATTRPVAVATVNGDLVALKGLFRFAVREGWLLRSPTDGVRPLSGEPKRRIKTLTDDEEARLFAGCKGGEVIVTAARNRGGRAGGKSGGEVTFRQPVHAPDYLYPLVVTALYCGFRRKTLLSVRWKDLDFDNQRWRIPGEFMKTVKDYEAPVPTIVLKTLAEYRQTLAEKAAEKGQSAVKRLSSTARIFGLNPDTEIKQSFGSACRRAGLEGFTFHDLRRCYLNRLRQKGVSIETAMQLTAHKSLQTVLQHYREVPYSDLEEAVAALGGGSSETVTT